MTTFETTVAALRTWLHLALEAAVGEGVDREARRFWPICTRPTSASSMDVSTCMSVRLRAMMNSSGACRLAATVCPGSTLRLTTTPSTGERISVRPRSTRAWATCASRWRTTASLFAAWASATCSCARAASQRRFRLVAVGGGNELPLDQHLLSLVVALRVGKIDLRLEDLRALDIDCRAGGFEIGFGLTELVLEGLGVDAGDQLVRLYRRIEVDQDFLDLAGDLRADLYGRDRIERAGGGDDRGERSAFHLRQLESRLVAVTEQEQRSRAGSDCNDNSSSDQGSAFHGGHSTSPPFRRSVRTCIRGPEVSPTKPGRMAGHHRPL